MKKQKKIFCGAAALFMAVVIALSVAFVVKEADHTCFQDDCRICRQISACLNLFGTPASASGTALSALAAAFAVLFVIGSVRRAAVINNLTEMKVKLLN